MEDKSSWLLDLLGAPLTLVNGVLWPFTEPVGVVVRDEGPVPAAFFAAFSARRFCLEAEGAIVRVWSESTAPMSINLISKK